MSVDDERLKALFAQDEPPARDPAFSTAVMEAVARRKFFGDVALIAGLSAALGAALWWAWPVAQPMLAPLADLAMPVAAGLTLAALVVWMAERTPSALRI